MPESAATSLFQSEGPERAHKRVNVVLPVRITYWDAETKPALELGCTYDISPQGARISRLKTVKEVGDIIAIERGRNKAFCRVVWIGEPNSELSGQVGIQCVEMDRVMWEAELRDLEDTYDPIRTDNELKRTVGIRSGERNRRRFERFMVQGCGEMLENRKNGSRAKGELKDISEFGCLIQGCELLDAGSRLKLDLKVAKYSLSFKGEVRHAGPEFGVGIEFHEIRKGDRHTLQFLLRKLAEHQLEQSFELELA